MNLHGAEEFAHSGDYHPCDDHEHCEGCEMCLDDDVDWKRVGKVCLCAKCAADDECNGSRAVVRT
jgi:hypothetical protein